MLLPNQSENWNTIWLRWIQQELEVDFSVCHVQKNIFLFRVKLKEIFVDDFADIFLFVSEPIRIPVGSKNDNELFIIQSIVPLNWTINRNPFLVVKCKNALNIWLLGSQPVKTTTIRRTAVRVPSVSHHHSRPPEKLWSHLYCGIDVIDAKGGP